MKLTPKFNIGARVTVAPLDEEEAQPGAMDGIVVKIDMQGCYDQFYENQDDIGYVVLLDTPLFSHPAESEPTVDACESELTLI